MPFMPGLDQILRVMEARRHRLYRGAGGQRGLNIVGIRRAAGSPDKFDDTIAVFYLLPNAADLMLFAITTDPSLHYLRHPTTATGTPILKEGQYVDAYALATHRAGLPGGHLALCQCLAGVTVFRDATRDGRLNYVNPDTGMFGIDIHKGPADGDWDGESAAYAAGCQVFADLDDFDLFLRRCRKERDDTGSNVFTYTLLNQKDFG